MKLRTPIADAKALEVNILLNNFIIYKLFGKEKFLKILKAKNPEKEIVLLKNLEKDIRGMIKKSHNIT